MTQTADYPMRGYSIVQPSIAETRLTGWLATVRFSRLGHEYDIKFISFRMPGCLRDNKPIAWHKMNAKARAVAHKAADFLGAAAKLSPDLPRQTN